MCGVKRENRLQKINNSTNRIPELWTIIKRSEKRKSRAERWGGNNAKRNTNTDWELKRLQSFKREVQI